MSIANNCFSLLHWDAKREISSYLVIADAATFNEVLRLDERVFKKLPRDFALKHALAILKQEHNSIIKRYQICHDAYNFPVLRRTAKRMFRFCLTPRSEIAFMHQKGVREKMIGFLEPWTDEHSWVWEGASAIRKENLLGLAMAALEVVSDTHFLRHITL